MRILAINDIQEGEELTISYINRFQPLKARREFLQRQFYFLCSCSECQFETAHPIDSSMESILDKKIPLESRLVTLKGLFGKRNLLFAYYMTALQTELAQKIQSRSLKESKFIMDMLISPENNEIIIDALDLSIQRDIYDICYACEAAQHPEGPTRRLMDLEARRNRIIDFLKGTE